jgi:hypothetical protein
MAKTKKSFKKTDKKTVLKRTPASKLKRVVKIKSSHRMSQFKASILSLISETSTNLPPDVRRALTWAIERETPGSQAALALQMMAVNTDMACDNEAPICQDTGMRNQDAGQHEPDFHAERNKRSNC